MASKKQRRRDQKLRRHEWEYVVADEEGNQVAVAPRELRAKKEAAKPQKQAPAARGGRAQRRIQPPSWQRAFRRTAMIALPMVVVITLLSKKMTSTGKIAQALVLLALFPVLVYTLDRFTWRAYVRKTGGPPPGS